MSKRSWDIEDLKSAVGVSKSIADVMRRLNLRTAGGSYNTIQKYIKMYELNIDHFDPYAKSVSSLKDYSDGKRISLETILVEDTKYKSGRLKDRLIKEGLLENKCYECGLRDMWNGKSIVMQLDHINGVHNDCRLSNLRLLCPNCHSQTETFAGRSVKKDNSAKLSFVKCTKCNVNWIHKNSKTCLKCYNISQRKINRPSKVELEYLISNNSLTSIGKMFGVSGNTIKKWAKAYDLN